MRAQPFECFPKVQLRTSHKETLALNLWRLMKGSRHSSFSLISVIDFLRCLRDTEVDNVAVEDPGRGLKYGSSHVKSH